MANLKEMMLEEIRKSPLIQDSYVDETEELIDTGLPKTDENIQAAAIAYLDEKGYRRRFDNVEYAKQMIMEVSEDYDTVIVKRRKVTETDLFEKASISELRDAMDVCLLENVSSLNSKISRLVNKEYEYTVTCVDGIKMESERPRGHLAGDFETLEETLNKYAKKGWELDKIHTESTKTNGGVNRTYLIFKKEKMD